MAIIKHNDAQQVTSQAVVLDLSDLHRQADHIVDNAREQARQIIADAQREARALIDAADTRGHAQGHERGLAEGRVQGAARAERQVLEEMKPQFEQLAGNWIEMLEAWDQARGDMMTQAGVDVLTFAFELAQRVIHRVVAFDPTVIETQLTEAMAIVAQPSSLVIEINPDDRPSVERVLPRIIDQLGISTHAALRDNSDIMPGGCVLRTADGSVDATIGTQLDRLAAALLPEDVWPRRHAPSGDEPPRHSDVVA